jgi:Nif-specific regulatory protein
VKLVTTESTENKDKPFYETVKNYKRYVIEDALKKSNGNQSKAARLLGLQRTYLARLIRQLNISVKD